jgi:serine/threonine-protein kinase
MKPNMPLVTLLTGAALGVGVLIASALSPSNPASASGYSATSPASPVAGGTPAPALSASATPSASSASPTAPASSASATATATAPASVAPVAPASVAPAAPTTAPAIVPTATASVYQADVPAKADYVAQVNSGGAAVAISVHAGKAVAYVCNGHAVAAWYKGTAKGGKLNLTGKNGARLDVSYRTGKATGSLVADGTKYTFSAPLVHRVSSGHRPPGLYEATAMVHGVPIKAGWVVLPNGSQVGSVEYFPGSDVAPTAQAPVLNLTTGTAQYDGITLVASLISGLTGSGF